MTLLTDTQVELLEAKARELVDLALAELDLSKWPDLETKEGRGDRVWMKKNAIESMRLVDQIRSLLVAQPTPLVKTTETDEKIAARLTREAEKRAGSMRGRNESSTPH